MQEFVNLSSLRAYNPGSAISNGELAYVKGYANVGDGGGGFFIYRNSGAFITHPYYSVDNGGTLIKPTSGTQVGIWVRQLDGHVSVAYFGALGNNQEVVEGDYTIKFQRAIENAYQNSLGNSMLGSTVYVPNGGYILETLNLRSGISFVGENLLKTVLYGMLTPSSNYLFTMDPGAVFINMSNFNIQARETDASTSNQGCFHFEARGTSIGGLWYSSFKNIQVTQFKGIGMHLNGGSDPTSPEPQKPNQFNIFENVRITRKKGNIEALLMTGQQGQITFLNCQFDGTETAVGYTTGHNVYIKNKFNGSNGKNISSYVVSFINSTFQTADYGMIIENSENITIDNCWFENLGVAITVRPDTTNNTRICRTINILNSRFANAAGFGVLELKPQNAALTWAPAIQIVNSQVNVHNNYITDVRDDMETSPYSFSAFLQVVGNSQGVSVIGNCASESKAGRSLGIAQNITVSSNSIDSKYNKVVYVSGAATIQRFYSGLAASESIVIKAVGQIKFDNSGNINFSNMNLSGSNGNLVLDNGEEALFTKVDNFIFNGSGRPIYFYTMVLTSVVRYTTS